MSSRLTLSSAVFLLLMFSAPGAFARERSTNDQQGRGTYTIHQNINEVILHCTVLDKKKRIVTSLEEKDFSVEENGSSQKIVAFKHEDIPVSIGLILDSSGSMRDKESAVATASLDLIKASNAMDETFVVSFSEDAVVQQGFTSDIATISQTLSSPHRSFGGTALYDAVNLSASRMASSAKHSKQVLIVITDGHDNASKTDLSETIQTIQKLNGPIVYTIGLLYDTPGSEAHKSKEVLQLLAEETGGMAFFPHNLGEIDAIAAEVAQDIRNQYLIAYRPANATRDSEYRTIHVTATRKGLGQLLVRTRKGYAFNQKLGDK